MSQKIRTISDMPWFKFFGGNYLPFVEIASAESAGLVFKAVCCYVCEKPENAPQLTDPLAQALFQSIKKDIDDSFETYQKKVEGGKLGGRPKKGESKTIPNHSKPNLTYPNHTEPYRTEEEAEVEVEVKPEVDVEQKKEEEADMQSGICFVIPTIDEVTAYCMERGNTIDPQWFIDYCRANGWTQKNGRPIRDWKAIINMWERWDRTADAQEPIQRKAYRTEVVNGEEVDVLVDQ